MSDGVYRALGSLSRRCEMKFWASGEKYSEGYSIGAERMYPYLNLVTEQFLPKTATTVRTTITTTNTDGNDHNNRNENDNDNGSNAYTSYNIYTDTTTDTGSRALKKIIKNNQYSHRSSVFSVEGTIPANHLKHHQP